jgi:hypothetical protein
MHAVGDEHLGAVEHIAVAVAARGGANALDVGAGARLGDADRDDLPAGDDIGHPAILQRRRAGVEQMHRGHIGMNQHRDRHAREGRSTEFFGQYDRGQRVHLRAAILRGIADAEKAELAHAAQHLARHHAVLLPLQRPRLDLLVDKAAKLGAQQFMLLAEIDRTRLAAGNSPVHADPPRLFAPAERIGLLSVIGRLFRKF